MKFKSDEIVSVGRKGIYEINTGAWRKLRPLTDTAKCTKCSICYQYCPVFSIVKTEEGFYIPTTDYCKGCGICANECPAGAITMVPEVNGGR